MAANTRRFALCGRECASILLMFAAAVRIYRYSILVFITLGVYPYTSNKSVRKRPV